MYKDNRNGKRKLIAVHGCTIVIDFANLIIIFTFTLNEYWHDGRANLIRSFRSGSCRPRLFRPRSFRPCGLSANLVGPFDLLLAHLSHRLTRWAYSIVMFWRPSVVQS